MTADHIRTVTASVLALALGAALLLGIASHARAGERSGGPEGGFDPRALTTRPLPPPFIVKPPFEFPPASFHTF
jgi:hypothetical protein